jgi:cytoskeletal protein RodZ
MKEGPASSMLRAMFAGFGSLMSVMDRVRNKPPAEAPADAGAPAAAATPAPQDTAAAEDTATPETVAPETVDPETVALQTVAPETVAAESSAAAAASAGTVTVAAPEATATSEPETSAAPETSAGSETSAATEPSGTLPLANYDELSVASLRARLRNLTNDDLTLLMAYEKAHQDRPEVIKMFQNRLVKMTTGLQKLVE